MKIHNLISLSALAVIIAVAGQVQAVANAGANSNSESLAVVKIAETPTHHNARMRWWRQARFGMFIHWGVYSVLAGYYHGKPVAIAGFGFDAPDVWPRLKQRFTLEAFTDGGWHQVANGRTEGYAVHKAIVPVTAKEFRLTMECDKGSPGAAEIQLYGAE